MVDTYAGRLLAELLQEHAEPLAELRTRLGADEPAETDQVLLRFLLQACGSVDEAEDAAKQGRKDRAAYAAVIEKAARGEALPQEPAIRKHLIFGHWEYPRAADGAEGAGSPADWPPLLVTRTGRSDPQALMDNLSEEQVVEFFVWMRSRIYSEVLQATERTGKLLLMASINDLADASLWSRDSRFFAALGKVTKLGEGLSPFLARKHILVNCGVIVPILMGLARLFLSQKVMDKVSIMSCEQLQEALGVPAESIPEFLGGGCKVPPRSPLYAEEEVLDVEAEVY